MRSRSLEREGGRKESEVGLRDLGIGMTVEQGYRGSPLSTIDLICGSEFDPHIRDFSRSPFGFDIKL